MCGEKQSTHEVVVIDNNLINIRLANKLHLNYSTIEKTQWCNVIEMLANTIILCITVSNQHVVHTMVCQTYFNKK